MDRRVLLYSASDPSNDLPQARRCGCGIGRCLRRQGDADDEEESHLTAALKIFSAPDAFP